MFEQRIIELMAEERMQRAKEEAAQARLLRNALPPSMPLLPRLAVSLGAWLVAVGTLIEERYETVSYSTPETDCSTC